MERNYSTNITELIFSNYKFQVYYFEKINQNIPEFPHRHEMYEIYHAVNGSLLFETNNTWHVIHEGETVFLDKNIPHHVYYDPSIPKEYFVIIYDFIDQRKDYNKSSDGESEYEDIKGVLEIIHEKGFIISNGFNAGSLIDELLQEQCQKLLGWNTQITLLSYRLVTSALRTIHACPVKDRWPSGQRNLVMEVTMYIHEHYMEEITIEDVAKALGVSERHLNREYKNTLGITFIKNLNRLRMEYAKDFICHTTEPIESIVEKVGLSSTTMLYHLFQEFEGMSVSQYKEKHKR